MRFQQSLVRSRGKPEHITRGQAKPGIASPDHWQNLGNGYLGNSGGILARQEQTVRRLRWFADQQRGAHLDRRAGGCQGAVELHAACLEGDLEPPCLADCVSNRPAGPELAVDEALHFGDRADLDGFGQIAVAPDLRPRLKQSE